MTQNAGYVEQKQIKVLFHYGIFNPKLLSAYAHWGSRNDQLVKLTIQNVMIQECLK